MTIVKDVFIEQLRAGDLVCTGTTRHLVEEWQTVRSVKSPNTPLNTYSVAFGGLTIERRSGTKMRVQIDDAR